MFFHLKCCSKCNGDLVTDGDEWRCWQCGQYYYPKPSVLELPLPPPRDSYSEEPTPVKPRRRRRSRWAAEDINSLIVAKDRSEKRWWDRNSRLIQYLDEGFSVKEVSALVGRSERQVRVVREQLRDIRGTGEDHSPSFQTSANFTQGVSETQ